MIISLFICEKQLAKKHVKTNLKLILILEFFISSIKLKNFQLEHKHEVYVQKLDNF